MPRQISRTSCPTSRIDGGAQRSRISAAGWMKPLNPVSMCARVAISVAHSPASPMMMCILSPSSLFLFAEALERLQHREVEGVQPQGLLPGLARQVLVPEPLVERALH